MTLGAIWFSGRQDGKRISKELYTSAVDLSACVDTAKRGSSALRDELELSPPDSTPLVGCAALAQRVRSQTQALAKIRFKRDPDGVRELIAVEDTLQEGRFRARADELAAGEVESLETGVSALLKGACRIAIGEGSLDFGACPPPSPTTEPTPLPTAHVVLDAPAEFIQRTALALDAADGELRLSLASRERDQDAVSVQLGRSHDRGLSFKFVTGSGGRAEGRPDVPVVLYRHGAPSLVLTTLRDENRVYSSAWVARIEAGAARLGSAIELPALPEGLEPLVAGTPLWLVDDAKAGAAPLIFIGPRDPSRQGGAALRLGGDGKVELLSTPPGTLIALLTRPKPRLIVVERAPDDSAQLALYDIPESGWKWGSPLRLPLPTGAVVAEPMREAACGVHGETVFPFVARRARGESLIALGEQRLHAFGLERGADAELSPVCGNCPASLLSASDDTLRLLFPVGNTLAALPFAAPLVVTGRHSVKRSVGTCDGEVVLVAHVTEGRVLTQVTRIGRWQAERPVLVAAPNEIGSPVDVRVAALDGRFYVVWRRDTHMRALLEMLTSDDGGRSWH